MWEAAKRIPSTFHKANPRACAITQALHEKSKHTYSCCILPLCLTAILTCHYGHKQFKWTFSACRFCFPISDHVMFSWEFSFCLFTSYAYICTCIRRHLKETILWSSITWSGMGKQNVPAEKVHCAKAENKLLSLMRFWQSSSPLIGT